MTFGLDGLSSVGSTKIYYSIENKNDDDSTEQQQQPSSSPASRWSPEVAALWMERHSNPYLNLGIDKFLVSTASNTFQMWQQEPFPWEQIRSELKHAKSVWNIGAVRVYLHPLLFGTVDGDDDDAVESPPSSASDGTSIWRKLDVFFNLCASRNIRPVLVLLDSTMNPYLNATDYPPIPGIHNSRWVQSPGRQILEQSELFDAIVEPYVRTILSKYGNDPRILAIDLWNEPFETNGYTYGHEGDRVSATEEFKGTELEPDRKRELIEPLVEKVWEWARSVGTIQTPLLMNAGGGGSCEDEKDSDTTMEAQGGFQIMAQHADVLLLPTTTSTIRRNDDGIVTSVQHTKIDLEAVQNATERRPVMMMHGLARDEGVDFISTLQEFQPHWIFVDGLAAGQSQLQYPPRTWNQDVLANSWHANLMHPDGAAYSTEEARYVQDWVATKFFTGTTAEGSRYSEASSLGLPDEALTDTEEALLFIVLPVCIIGLMIILLCLWELSYRRKRQRIKQRKTVPPVGTGLGKTSGPTSPFLTVCLATAAQEAGALDRQLLVKAIKSQFPTLASAVPFGTSPSSTTPTSTPAPSDAEVDTEVIDIQNESSPLPVIGCAMGGKDSIPHSAIQKLIKQMGAFLHPHGIGVGDRVAVVLPPHAAELATCILAVANWASCVVIPADQSEDQVQHDIVKSRAKVIIGFEKEEDEETGDEGVEESKGGFLAPMGESEEEEEKKKKKSKDEELDVAKIASDLAIPFAAMTPAVFECGEYSLAWKTDDVSSVISKGSKGSRSSKSSKSKRKLFENEFKDEVLVFITKDPETSERRLQTCTLGDILIGSVTVSFLWNLSAADVAFSLMPMSRMESVLHQVFVPVLSGGGTVIGQPHYFWPFIEEREKRFTWYYADHTAQEQILESSLEHDIQGVSLRLIAIPSHDFHPFEARELNSMFGAQVVLAYGMDFYKRGNVRGSSPKGERYS